jgi:Holliday junction resolvase
MNRYAKGANYERKLVSDFWVHGWAAMRAAGTTVYPVPDVIAAKGGRIILVECKTTKKDRLSLKTNMLELKKFADICGGDAYIAIRFYRKEQRFYFLERQLSKGNYTITENDPFMSLDMILSEQTKL